MRRQLLDLIICPNCQKNEFEISVAEENEIEIRKGDLVCIGCDNHFEIDEGILNLLTEPTEEVVSEQKGWAELVNAVENTDELMLSLPDALDEHKPAWASMAVNFHYMWSQLQLSGDERVLDLGSGRCWSTRYFAREGCYAVGLDIVPTKYVGLQTADIYIEHDNAYFERILGDMNRLPFQKEAFDLIYVAATIHHSSDLTVSMNQIQRVLKPGGRLVLINEPTVGVFQDKTLDCVEVEYGINEHVYWFREYRKALRQAGMSYKLYPYMGSYHPALAYVNITKKKITKQMAPDYIWLPVVYSQLSLFGGILNIIAEKPIN